MRKKRLRLGLPLTSRGKTAALRPPSWILGEGKDWERENDGDEAEEKENKGRGIKRAWCNLGQVGRRLLPAAEGDGLPCK